MISWMQKHKKYLIITIWISTIAFVGAGFVGWGAYSFGNASNAVAKVGDIKVSVKEYQREYSKIFGLYQQLFNGNFDEAKAKEMKIEQIALDRLITKAYMINVAQDFGLYVSDEEVAKELGKIKDFQKDGKFDKNLYVEVLKNSRLKPNDFEQSLKEDILLKKFYSAIKPSINDIEKEAVLSAFFMKDALKISIIDGKNLKVDIKDDELKAFWEKSKDKYMTQEIVNMDIYKTELSKEPITDDEIKQYYEENKQNFVDSDGKILDLSSAINSVRQEIVINNTKKEANKNFYKFKNNELNATQSVQADIQSLTYDEDSILKVSEAQVGDILKPIKVDDGFILIKVKEKIPPRVKTYEEALENAKKDYEIAHKAKLLEEKAKEKVANFEGVDIGFVSRNNTTPINGLSINETNVFLNQLFSKNSKKDFVILEDKAIIYEILSQNISKDSNNDDMFNDNISNIKETLLDKSLMKLLAQKYEVEKYVK